MKIRNKTLYKKIKRFIIASMAALDEFSSKERIPKNSNFFADDEEKYDFSLFIFYHRDQLEKIPEFLDCARYLLKNPITRKAVGWKDKEGNFVKDLPLKLKYFRVLQILLTNYARSSNDFSFKEEIFDNVYTHFEKGTYSSFTVHKITAPLEGVFGDFEELNFGNTIKIRKITNNEKESINRLNLSPSPFFFPKVGAWDLDFFLEGFYTHAKDTAIKTSVITDEFREIITTLRLFKFGSVGYSYVKTETLTWTTQLGTSYGWGYSRQGTIEMKKFELTKPETLEVIRLWKKYLKFRKSLGKSDTGRFFNLAIKWFNMGVEEKDFENKIIDFFVSFEALCLPEKNELSYRLSNRVALLLSKDCEELTKIRKFMIIAYKVRSNIVHGGKVNPITVDGQEIHLRDFSQKVEQYLRDILKIVLSLLLQYNNQTKIIELVDRAFYDYRLRKKLRKHF